MPSAVLSDSVPHLLAMNTAASADWLRNELDSDNVLILDCRLQSEHARGHIRGAINVTLPSLLLRRLANGKVSIASLIKCNESREKFVKRWKSHTVVLCGGADSELDAADSMSNVAVPNGTTLPTLYRKLEQDGCQVAYLKGGYLEFYEKYPEWCASTERCLDPEGPIIGLQNLRISPTPSPSSSVFFGHCSDTDSSSSEDFCDSSLEIGDGGTPPIHDPCPFPVEILPNLYLGNARNSADSEALERNHICYVLNVTSDLPNIFEHEAHMKYLQIPIDDHWSQDLASFFPEAIAFIDEARQKELGVLVHCLAGISRSVTVTMAYLMMKFSMPLNDAYDFVKKRKSNISPNFSFMGQLLDFERQLNLSPASRITSSLPCPCSAKGPCMCNSGTTPDSGIDIGGNWA